MERGGIKFLVYIEPRRKPPDAMKLQTEQTESYILNTEYMNHNYHQLTQWYWYEK